MKDADCVEFLRWCLPKLGLRWEGFRKVRGQVCKRIDRRLGELELSCIREYREYVEDHADEWELLDEMCRITISRFYRDKGVYDRLCAEVLPRLVEIAKGRGDKTVCCWSAGCASGEEAYSLNILWKACMDSRKRNALEMKITATEALNAMLERCRQGIYTKSSLKDLPVELVRIAFDRRGNEYVLRGPYRKGIKFIRQDIRRNAPAGMFHLIMCRNLAFTYFEDRIQQEILGNIDRRLVQGGFLVIGVHESLPLQAHNFAPIENCPCIYEKTR
jgi:chemotaxis protein methyltransferase CheR